MPSLLLLTACSPWSHRLTRDGLIRVLIRAITLEVPTVTGNAPADTRRVTCARIVASDSITLTKFAIIAESWGIFGHTVP